jgi:cell division protein FtsN
VKTHDQYNMKQSDSPMAKSRNKQRGGTLLGIIIGALLGLGAALAVAVYVTKVPIPFMNRAQSHSAENDAAEAKKNRDWDPNAPLAGKNPARPATAPAGAPGVDAAIPPAPPTRSAATENPPASSDPLGDLANARAKARATTKPDAAVSASGVDPFSYFIQAGAFRTPEDAEQQRAKLSLLGFQSRVTEREQAGRTVYRVRLGPFDKKDEADKVKERLDGNSVDTALVRVQR